MKSSETHEAEDREVFTSALTVIVPLRPAEGEWSPPVTENDNQVVPLIWHDWYSYIGVWRNGATAPLGARGFLEKIGEGTITTPPETPEKTLSGDPTNEPPGKRQPLIRVPGAYGFGVSFHDYFLNHIEHFLYPGITRFRDSEEGRDRTDRLPEFHELPSRRWIGLPRSETKVKVSLAPASFEGIIGEKKWSLEPRAKLPRKIELSLDGAEVFTAYLGPSPRDFGPTSLGIFHYSWGRDEAGYAALNALDSETQLGLIATVTEVLTSPVNVEAVEPGQPIISVSFSDTPADRGADATFDEHQEFTGSSLRGPKTRYSRCHEWVVDFLCGNPLDRMSLNEGTAREGRGQELGVRRGGSFIAYLSPSIAYPSTSEARAHDHNSPESVGPDDFGVNPEGKGPEETTSNGIRKHPVDNHLGGLASFNPEPSEIATFSPSGRIRAAASWRGLVLVNTKGNNDGLTEFDVRNLRSFWLQGWLMGLIQLQTLKAFAAELSILGKSYKAPEALGSLYEQWLEFRNTVWWSDLVYESPTVEKLLRQQRDVMETERFFSELAEDFEVYVERSRQIMEAEQAARQEEEAKRRETEEAAQTKEREQKETLLRSLQIVGLPVVLIGAWAAYREIAAYTAAKGDNQDFFSLEGVLVVFLGLILAFVVIGLTRLTGNRRE